MKQPASRPPRGADQMSESEFKERLAALRRRQQRGNLVRTVIMLIALVAIGVLFALRGSGPEVRSVTPATALDDRFLPVEVTDTYAPDDTFFVSVEVRGYRAGMPLSARWLYEGEVLRETPLSTEYSGDGAVGFLLHSEAPWPAGAYSVEIVYEGKYVLGSAAFRVVAPEGL